MSSRSSKTTIQNEHEHSFRQDQVRSGEARTILVIAITASMMVVEIAGGIAFGSMALLADGLHMASHAAALGITAFAYVYARRHAHDKRFSFGTGKVNSLGGFAGAVLLAVFAVFMGWESIERVVRPIPIAFNQAIFVAVLGLIVNGVSVFILGDKHHDHEEGHVRDERPDVQSVVETRHGHDHNLRAAYLHVLADALTSLLAIFALLAGKYLGLTWMDPVMGIVGAGLVARWSFGLIRVSGRVLLDHQASEDVREQIIDALENSGECRVVDLHLWCIGPGIYSTAISVLAGNPMPPEAYKRLLPEGLGIVHVTMEVNPSA
jgi:cation diffusion facilitator family transporter